MPARRNSPYASSTTTIPSPAASQSMETASGGSAVPVGLLGLGSSTTEGRRSSTSRRAASRSRVKSSSRRPTTHSVIASRAYSGYIE